MTGTFSAFTVICFEGIVSLIHISQPSMIYGRRGGLMVSALVSRSSGPGSSSGQGHCVVFLGKTLNSHGASLHPGV